jgi:hypothetical protein
MTIAAETPNHSNDSLESTWSDAAKTTAVLQELERILASRFFKNSQRKRQFLEYVVHRKLEGHCDQLKERTIGVALFNRVPAYATGDDPVVRVQAGEVRRRLEQFYQEEPNHAGVKIELPLGSYAPVFNWISSGLSDNQNSPVRILPLPLGKRPWRSISIAAVLVFAAICASFAFYRMHATQRQQSALEQFWAPAFATPQPVLICLAKPILYRPSPDTYQKYARAHPGNFESEVERSNRALPLDPNQKLVWSDMVQYPDYGVAVGDVDAAIKVSALLGGLQKPSQVRIGSNYSYQDLRNSPAVIVGAFNNKWTMQIAPGLHFALVEENGLRTIHEQVPGGRTWSSIFQASLQASGVDYAIVARLLDSKTGQFTVIAAGLTGSGTQTAGEFASNRDDIAKAVRTAPADWQTKNMELVLRTTITESVAGPPEVVAAYYW